MHTGAKPKPSEHTHIAGLPGPGVAEELVAAIPLFGVATSTLLGVWMMMEGGGRWSVVERTLVGWPNPSWLCCGRPSIAFNTNHAERAEVAPQRELKGAPQRGKTHRGPWCSDPNPSKQSCGIFIRELWFS